jgi:Bacterial regulatory helix-turn-helix protein, lysR family
MLDMRLEKLRQVDLNLLIIFAVIAEEKSVTRASARLLLSQPAVSRALSARVPCSRTSWWFARLQGLNSRCEGARSFVNLNNCFPK